MILNLYVPYWFIYYSVFCYFVTALFFVYKAGISGGIKNIEFGTVCSGIAIFILAPIIGPLVMIFLCFVMMVVELTTRH